MYYFNKYIFTVLTSVLAVFFIVPDLHAKTDATEIIKKVQERYQTYSALQVGFEQSYENPSSGQKISNTGEIFFKKPFLVRWEVKTPEPSLLVIGEKFAWQYYPEEETVYRYSNDSSEISNGLVQVLLGADDLTKNFDITVLEQTATLLRLRAVAKEPTMDLVEAEIFIDIKKQRISRIISKDFYSAIVDTTIKSMKENPTIKDSLFTFTVPSGVMLIEN